MANNYGSLQSARIRKMKGSTEVSFEIYAFWPPYGRAIAEARRARIIRLPLLGVRALHADALVRPHIRIIVTSALFHSPDGDVRGEDLRIPDQTGNDLGRTFRCALRHETHLQNLSRCRPAGVSSSSTGAVPMRRDATAASVMELRPKPETPGCCDLMPVRRRQ